MRRVVIMTKIQRRGVEMDKQKAIKTIRAASYTSASYGGALQDVAEWLEQTETVEEVTESLSKLMERTSHMHVICIFPDGSGRIVDTYKSSLPIAPESSFDWWERKSSVICELSQEPSSEPPDPSEIEPGMEVPLKNGNRANIWRESKYSRFIGIATDVFGEGVQIRWNDEGSALIDGPEWLTLSINWQEWRRRNAK